jgi:hypothetical protein
MKVLVADDHGEDGEPRSSNASRSTSPWPARRRRGDRDAPGRPCRTSRSCHLVHAESLALGEATTHVPGSARLATSDAPASGSHRANRDDVPLCYLGAVAILLVHPAGREVDVVELTAAWAEGVLRVALLPARPSPSGGWMAPRIGDVRWFVCGPLPCPSTRQVAGTSAMWGAPRARFSTTNASSPKDRVLTRRRHSSPGRARRLRGLPRRQRSGIGALN